jgi:predicted unusual protein kinase regulating ubiquinone biosynthesis (AarF/ABC1/UbiB family)
MSFEEGVRIDDVQAVRASGVEFSVLMEKLVLFYTEQMLVKGYFHADPHPGNLLVNQAGELVLLDYGMVSRIPSHIRQAMIYAVKAAYERNFEMLVSAVRRMGILTEQAPQDQLVDIAESLFAIFDSQQLAASSMQDLAFGVLQVLHDQPFKLPQDVIYVMRVSSLIEGLGTQYIENFNGIKDILPILKDNLGQALGDGESLLPQLRKEVMQLPLTLIKTRKVIELAEQGELTVRMAPADREYLLNRLALYARRFLWLIFWLALAFYLLLLDVPWSGYGSGICMLLALFLIVKKGH